jgi:hypothetical protein
MLFQCSQADRIREWWDEGDWQEFARDEELYGQESEEQDDFIVSPEEMELAAQMSALGLPTVLGGGIKHEVGCAGWWLDICSMSIARYN